VCQGLSNPCAPRCEPGRQTGLTSCRGGSSGGVDFSDKSKAALYFEQERELVRLRVEKVDLARRVRVLEGRLKGAAAPKGGGWDLAVERGQKLSLAESQLTQLRSRVRLMERRHQRTAVAVAAWGKHQPAVEQAEAEVLACLAEIDQPWGTAAPPAGAEAEDSRPRRSRSKSPTAGSKPLAIGDGGG
jgi:hypothetical protein